MRPHYVSFDRFSLCKWLKYVPECPCIKNDVIKPYNAILRWSGKGWVEDLQQGEDAPWEFLMDVDLTPRPDTRRPNSSPYAAMTTIVSLQQGCNHTIVIPSKSTSHCSVFDSIGLSCNHTIVTPSKSTSYGSPLVPRTRME